jgi:hypothetical protein
MPIQLQRQWQRENRVGSSSHYLTLDFIDTTSINEISATNLWLAPPIELGIDKTLRSVLPVGRETVAQLGKMDRALV